MLTCRCAAIAVVYNAGGEDKTSSYKQRNVLLREQLKSLRGFAKCLFQ